MQAQWIAGFTSRALSGDRVGEERLVYLMRIGEKHHLRDYFNHPRFQDKIPDMQMPGPELKAGDNIYRPSVSGGVRVFPLRTAPEPEPLG